MGPSRLTQQMCYKPINHKIQNQDISKELKLINNNYLFLNEMVLNIVIEII
jgi:hypothetical protein